MGRLTTLKILWGAILAGSVTLFGVMLALAPGGDEPDLGLALLFGLLALSSAFASLVLPVALYRIALRHLEIPTLEADDESLPAGLASRTAQNPRAALDALFRAYQPPFVVGLALAESVGLCGFVLGFLGYSIETVMPFFITCWALIATRYPAVARVLGPAEALTGVQVPLDRT